MTLTLTPKQLADKLGMTQAQIYYNIKTGIIRANKKLTLSQKHTHYFINEQELARLQALTSPQNAK